MLRFDTFVNKKTNRIWRLPEPADLASRHGSHLDLFSGPVRTLLNTIRGLPNLTFLVSIEFVERGMVSPARAIRLLNVLSDFGRKRALEVSRGWIRIVASRCPEVGFEFSF